MSRMQVVQELFIPSEDECAEVIPAEANKPFVEISSRGITGVWEARCAIRQNVFDEAPEEDDIAALEEAQYQDEVKRLGQARAERRQKIRDFRRRQRFAIYEHMPIWQSLAGFGPAQESFVSPQVRQRQIGALLRHVDKLLRFEMAAKPQGAHGETGCREKECSSHDVGNNGADRQATAETHTAADLQAASGADSRTNVWDPLRSICSCLGISQRKLSSYAKEVLGCSAPEMVDVIRAEKMRATMKAELKNVVAEFFRRKRDVEPDRSTTAPPLASKNEAGNEDLALEIFGELRASRTSPRWHRTSWALGFGFTSYQKMFRAALICYGITPHQLEIALIDEILREAEAREGAKEVSCKEAETQRPEEVKTETAAAVVAEAEVNADAELVHVE